MANARASANGPQGAERTPFEQQRDALVGEIAIVRFPSQNTLPLTSTRYMANILFPDHTDRVSSTCSKISIS